METARTENVKSLLIDLLVIAVIWGISIVVVNPRGEFPLNDDWALAQTVKHFMDTGDYVPNPWLAMSLITNIVWGALFCVPFGFSFAMLRLSTLVMALVGMLALYWLGRELRLPRAARVIAALALGFNPIYHALSSTFMSDVPFTALATLSAVLLLRCLKDDSNASLYAGIAFAVAATLSRQLGMAVPLAFSIAYVLRFGLGFRPLLRGLAPLAICILALAALSHWLAAKGALPEIYTAKTAMVFTALLDPRVLLKEVLHGYVALVYFGLFLLPALVLALPALREEHTRRNVSIWLALVIAGGITTAFTELIAEPLLPMFGNIFDKAGIGPFTLRDTYILSDTLPALPNVFWSVLTWLGILGSVALVAALILFARQMWQNLRLGNTPVEAIGRLFLPLCAIAYLLPVFANDMSDRYLVPAIPFLMIGFLSLFSGADLARGHRFNYVGSALVLVFVLFSTCATRDYLTWNRVRWQALNQLTRVEGVKATEIDGGFEFNGLYLYDAAYESKPARSWWWVQDDTYLIAFHSVFGYDTVKEYTYSHWLPPYTGKIRVLKKNGLDAIAPGAAGPHL